MFTGLVEEVGRLRARTQTGGGARLGIDTKLGSLELGESISVMGVCLTVDAIRAVGFEADASSETLARTTLRSLAIGRGVHLERATALGGRFGGHIVSGHVDGMIRLLERRMAGASIELTYGVDPSLARFIAPKGSVTIDGVSLTVNEAQADRFSVMIVPHTRDSTLLGQEELGAISNLEVDILARYVARWLDTGGGQAHRLDESAAQAADEGLLRKLGSAGFL